jgi:hypothetical protein
MDTDIVYLGDMDYKPDVTSLLLYYYYGGVACLSLKQYDRAMQFFSVVISAPAEQVCHPGCVLLLVCDSLAFTYNCVNRFPC